MKIDHFNKIGGTEFRVQNQINGYISFANWIVEVQDDEEFKKNNNIAFIMWAKEQDIYNYSDNETTNFKKQRFNFVYNNALNIFKVIKINKNGKYDINYDIKKPIESIFNNLCSGDNKSNKAFYQTIKFIYENKNLTNTWKIFAAFCCYEEEDNFVDLYNLDIIKEISKKQFLKFGVEVFNKNFISKKPSKYIKNVCQNIKLKLDSNVNFSISDLEFEKTKKTYFGKYKNKQSLESEINSDNFDCNNFIINVLENKNSKLFFEYFDLFNKVLYGLGVSDSWTRKAKIYNLNNISIENNLIHTSLQDSIDLPFSIEIVNKYLCDIQNKNFSFKTLQTRLSSLSNSLLAEYFVNLKFIYHFNIKKDKIGKFMKTLVDRELFPISHAIGGLADMYYDVHNESYTIETTIHNTKNAIINNERSPTMRHLFDYVKKNNSKKAILYLIHFYGENQEIEKWFKHDFILFSNENIDIEFKQMNFKEVAEL